MSIKRKYISIDAQSKESLQEVRLINKNNVLHAQEIRMTNPETQQMDNIKDIFFSKEDGQQIAESIKEDVKEELKDDYLTIESAESRFISTSQANTFALKSELEGLASEDDVQATVQAAMEEVEETYLKKEDAATTYAKKGDVQDIVKKADFSQIAKIDIESEYTLADVVAKVNEILNILKNTEEH